MKKISLSEIKKLFDAISANEKLYIPVDTNGGAKFDWYSEGKTLSDELKTVRSAKDFFFPQTETLMKFKTEGKKIEIVDSREECEDFVIFGVRGCDVKSFEVLDNVFLNEPVDSYYKNRREHGVIMSLACNRPSETCFCTQFGIDASEPEGDIVCWKADGELYLEAKTEKGNALLEQISAVLTDCDSSAVENEKSAIKEKLDKLPIKNLPLDKFGAGKTKEFFDSPEWKKLSQSCLGCGTCTFVCPTCQCYDIKDFNTGKGVERFRCWDSCMYSEFTKMSAGQPRLTQLERFRQRFMHKLVYYPENNNGLFSCVGCGRCLNKCPIQMNIVKVIKALGGEAND